MQTVLENNPGFAEPILQSERSTKHMFIAGAGNRVESKTPGSMGKGLKSLAHIETSLELLEISHLHCGFSTKVRLPREVDTS